MRQVLPQFWREVSRSGRNACQSGPQVGSPPMAGDVRYEVDNHVATITFDRPEQLNAFRTETMQEFLAALDRIDADDDVRAAVVTGAGRAFCAGADLSSGAAAFRPVAT